MPTSPTIPFADAASKLGGDAVALGDLRNAYTKAGLPTDATSPTKTPTNPSTPVRPTVTPRIDINGLNTNPAASGSFGDYQASKDLTADEVSKVSNQYTDQLQSEMALINAQYAPKLAQDEDEKTAALARTKALNANTGNIDSGTGAMAVDTTTKKADSIIAQDNAIKFAKLQEATGQIDALKVKALQDARDAKSKDLADYQTARTANATAAENTLKNYIAAGGSVEALKNDYGDPKNPDSTSSYDHLASILGGPGALDALAIANAPKAAYVSDKPEIVGNKAIWFQKMSDGSLKQVSIDIPGDKSVQSVTRVPGEGLYVFHKDGTYTVLGKGGTGTASETKQGAIDKYTNSFVPGASLKDGTQILDDNGYINPAAWKQAINDAPKNGLTRADFIKQFGQFIYSNNGAKISPDYGLTPVEAKLILGSQKTGSGTGA